MGVPEDLERIALQERELILPRFDAEVAWKLGNRLRSIALERGLNLVIDVRRFGQPLFYAALDGTTPDNPEWVRRKINVVARFHRSSYRVGMTLKSKNETLHEKLGVPVADFAAAGGSFPLSVAGAGIVGCVTVSGLPQRSDHELVVEALCAELGRDYADLRLPPEQAS
ncbi:MAG: heme-degrading domain-containing protein [Terracidiphilus sp.]